MYDKEPPRDALLSWMEVVISLEHQICVIENLLSIAKEKVRQLEIPLTARKEEVKKENVKQIESHAQITFFKLLAFFYIFGWVLLAVLVWYYEGFGMFIASAILGFLWPIAVIQTFTLDNIGTGDLIILIYCIVSVILLIVVPASMSHNAKKRIRSRELRAEKKYQSDILDANNQYQQDLQRVTAINNTNKAKAKKIKEEIKIFSLLLEKYKTEREYLYETYNYLHPKYRGLGPVTALYSLLSTGQILLLYGADGAQNRFELDKQFELLHRDYNELKTYLQSIDSKFDTTIEQIHIINDHIDTISSGLGSMNNKLDSINLDSVFKKMDSIVDSNKKQEYDLQRIRDDISYQKLLAAYQSGYTNVRPTLRY